MLITSDFDAICLEAKKRAEVMVKNGLYSRFGLSQSSRVDKAFLGCIGELAFESYLIENKISYQTDSTDFTTKNSDEFDFLINSKKIDIKVAKKSTKRAPTGGWTYGYPKDQKPETKDFVIIGWVDFTQKEVGFFGWIRGIAISKYLVVTKNGFAGYAYKTPNHEFKWGALNQDFGALLTNIQKF